MPPPQQRTLVQQALRGTGFVIAISTGIIAAGAAIAIVFVVVMA